MTDLGRRRHDVRERTSASRTTTGCSARATSAAITASYDGFAADPGTFHLSWSDERGSDPDVYYATFPSTSPRDRISTSRRVQVVRLGTRRRIRDVRFDDVRRERLSGLARPLRLTARSGSLVLVFEPERVRRASRRGSRCRRLPRCRRARTSMSVTAAGPSLTRRTNVRFDVDRPRAPRRSR